MGVGKCHSQTWAQCGIAVIRDQGITQSLHTAMIYDRDTGRLVGDRISLARAPANAVIFRGPATLIAVSESLKDVYDHETQRWTRIELMDVATGKFEGEHTTGHTKNITSVALRPDRKVLATAGDDNTIRLTDLDKVANYTGDAAIGSPKTVAAGIRAMAFDPTGQGLAFIDDRGRAHLWNINTDRVTALADDTAVYTTLTFRPADKQLLAAGSSGQTHIVDVINPSTADRTSRLALNGCGTTWPVFSADGHILATSTKPKDRLCLWHLTAHPDW